MCAVFAVVTAFILFIVVIASVSYSVFNEQYI